MHFARKLFHRVSIMLDRGHVRCAVFPAQTYAFAMEFLAVRALFASLMTLRYRTRTLIVRAAGLGNAVKPYGNTE